MKNLSAIFLFSCSLFAAPVIAGSGHDHGHGHSHEATSSAVVITLAGKKVKQLAEAGKIDSTWAAIEASKAEQKTFAHDPEWVVSFKNDQIKETSKQTLYLFFSLHGQYIATNYTGE